MKWVFVDKYCWCLKDYPFFNTTIRVDDYKGNQSYRLDYQYEFKQFNNLKDAKSYVIKSIRKQSFIKDFSEIKSITIYDSGWPNNIGEGVYIKPYTKGIRYKWVCGMHQPWRSSSNSYSIRFPMNTSNQVLEDWIVKIYNKHLKRLKKETNDI